MLFRSKNQGIRLYDFSGGQKSDDGNPNTLMFYKQKWGGAEYTHYNLIKIHKKYDYALYKLLFSLIRRYYNFKGRKYRTSIPKTDETEL